MRLLLIVLISVPIALQADAAQNGAGLLKSCAAAFDGTPGITSVDSIEKETCCACYIEAVTDTNAYYLRNLLAPLIETKAISSRKGRKSGWSSTAEFQEAAKFHCPTPDDDLGPGKKMSIVMGYLYDHPERLDESAAVLVMDALAKAFPCETQQNVISPTTQPTTPSEIVDSEPPQLATQPIERPTTARSEPQLELLERSSEQSENENSGLPKRLREIQTNWRLLQEGMAADEVKALLGEPLKIDVQTRHNRSPRAHWYYSSDRSNARITFREGRVRRLRDLRKVWLVHSWEEPER
tara:strand:- start:910 stop:1797 length:888 start_codon:yes stop_codon:yes gene_type:complete